MNVFIFYLKQILYRWNFRGIKISWINYYNFFLYIIFWKTKTMEFKSHENNQLYGMIEFTHQIFYKFEAALLIIIIISKLWHLPT